MKWYYRIRIVSGGEHMAKKLNYNGDKGLRLLSIYERLNKGEILDKHTLAASFGVTAKTIQRDIDELRNYFADTHFTDGKAAIKYDKKRCGYLLVQKELDYLTNEEVLALCKILLESRAFEKIELKIILEKLVKQSSPTDRKIIEDLVRNEHFNYVPLKHGKKLLAPIWLLSQYINCQEIISFDYIRKDGLSAERVVKPVAIMFSEYYFYLIAFMADDSKDYPTVFRVDRISHIKSTHQRFSVPYKDRFDDGEFRKRVQFMFSGELRQIKFEYSGKSIESVLDRLPTAEIIKIIDDVYIIKAEVYGNGIDMWLRSQGDCVKIL